MGRHRTPVALRILQGNPQKRPLYPEPQPAIADECPAAPAWLPPYAREEWARTAPELHACGLLTAVDHAVMGAYCTAYSRWRLAEEALAREAESDPDGAGLTVRDARGTLRQNSLVRVARAAAEQMVSFAGQLGCTPIARARIGVIGGQDRGDGKFEGFLRG
jgi:P27 family predicted phage terminase small subunit